MQWSDIEKNWTAMIPAIRARWPDVSEEDLIALSGHRDEVIATLAGATGETPTDIARQMDEWRQGPMPADAYADPTRDNAAARDAGRYLPEGEDVYADDDRFGDEGVADRPMGRRG
ncbi:hypothetical protein roselon_02947 [Roseibacterium elongatum DSM 19469]|uniref:General stress protein CsbD n=1 Tax=Roseicyclus elongatus DSM 19469 TaxID=1294273 RepID=W8S4T2_9RHOB|nr:hypothetical protein [Roseibacterium elongatum]AHM05232.1 hypothetical protein roselon_02947 [Roseibacterium elongatum DSM 19469]